MFLFNNTVDDKDAIERLHQLNNELQERDVTGVCDYGCLFRDGETFTNGTQACISSVSSLRYNRIFSKNIPLAWIHTFKSRQGNGPTKVGKAFSEWMQNDSPWKYAYLYKDIFNAVKSNCVAVRCDIGRNYMATAMNVMRLDVENSEHTENWYRLVKVGVNPSAALSLCLNVGGVADKDNIVLDRVYGTFIHSIFSDTSTSTMFNLLSGKLSINDYFYKDLYCNTKNYNGAYGYLSEGRSNYFYRMLSSKYDPKIEKVSLGKNLMGKNIGWAEGKVFTVEQINNYWEELCTKYL